MRDLAIKAAAAFLYTAICTVLTWWVFGFIAWNWDITEWTFIARGFLVFVTAILFCVGVVKPWKE